MRTQTIPSHPHRPDEETTMTTYDITTDVPVLADGMTTWLTQVARTQAAEIETLRAQVRALQVDNAYLQQQLLGGAA